MSELHYPGTNVLRNKFGYTDPGQLATAESAITAARAAELARTPVAPSFDFEHLQTLHRHLFGDLYEWAGEQRTINTMAGNLGISHDPHESIDTEAERIFHELAESNYLRGRETTCTTLTSSRQRQRRETIDSAVRNQRGRSDCQ